MAQLAGALIHTAEGCGFDPRLGTYGEAASRSTDVRNWCDVSLSHQFLSFALSPSPPSSLKPINIFKIYMRLNFKKQIEES